MGTRSFMSAVRKWSRPVHRDLSFFFSGVLLIYAVSGFMLNHKRDFNSDYSVRRTELVFAQEIPSRSGPVRGPRNCSCASARRAIT